MRISAISTNTNNQNVKPNFNGSADFREINRFLTMLPNRLVKTHSAIGTDMLKTTTLIEKMSNKMEKFSRWTILNFRKKNEKEYDVFMENPYSNYKQVLPSLKLSETESALEDLDSFEKLAENVEKTNQFDVELKFCQMRHDGVLRDEFQPKL